MEVVQVAQGAEVGMGESAAGMVAQEVTAGTGIMVAMVRAGVVGRARRCLARSVQGRSHGRLAHVERSGHRQ